MDKRDSTVLKCLTDGVSIPLHVKFSTFSKGIEYLQKNPPLLLVYACCTQQHLPTDTVLSGDLAKAEYMEHFIITVCIHLFDITSCFRS